MVLVVVGRGVLQKVKKVYVRASLSALTRVPSSSAIDREEGNLPRGGWVPVFRV
jgi:hypothetical protein